MENSGFLMCVLLGSYVHHLLDVLLKIKVFIFNMYFATCILESLANHPIVGSHFCF